HPIFSCDGIMNSFHRNESYRKTTTCRIIQNELKEDANGDGKFGDDQGFVFPGAKPVIDCSEFNALQAEICTGPNGCPTDDSIKYHANAAYASMLKGQCESLQTSRNGIIVNAVVLIVASLVAIFWVVAFKKEHP